MSRWVRGRYARGLARLNPHPRLVMAGSLALTLAAALTLLGLTAYQAHIACRWPGA